MYQNSEWGKTAYCQTPKISRWLVVLVCTLSLTFISLSLKRQVRADEQESPLPQQEQGGSKSSVETSDEEVIDGTADELERYEKEGKTILIGNVKIKRPNGFLNADKVTIYEDVETGEATKTVAEGNVEIRDADIFATCDHALLNHVDDTVDLHDNVVVIQNEDRLETQHFTFNRRTGKQTGDGGVKFKVRMKRAQKSDQEVSKTEQEP